MSSGAGQSEALQAVSARVRRAAALLRAGRPELAQEALERLLRVLPRPERRHVEAAWRR